MVAIKKLIKPFKLADNYKYKKDYKNVLLNYLATYYNKISEHKQIMPKLNIMEKIDLFIILLYISYNTI